MALQEPYSGGMLAEPLDSLSYCLQLCTNFQILFPEHDNDSNRQVHFEVFSRPKGQERNTIDRPFLIVQNDYEIGIQKRLDAAAGWFTTGGNLSVGVEVDLETVRNRFCPQTEDRSVFQMLADWITGRGGDTNTDEELIRVWQNLIDELISQLVETAYGETATQAGKSLDIKRVHSVMAGRNSGKDKVTHGAGLIAGFKVEWGMTQ